MPALCSLLALRVISLHFPCRLVSLCFVSLSSPLHSPCFHFCPFHVPFSAPVFPFHFSPLLPAFLAQKHGFPTFSQRGRPKTQSFSRFSAKAKEPAGGIEPGTPCFATPAPRRRSAWAMSEHFGQAIPAASWSDFPSKKSELLPVGSLELPCAQGECMSTHAHLHAPHRMFEPGMRLFASCERSGCASAQPCGALTPSAGLLRRHLGSTQQSKPPLSCQFGELDVPRLSCLTYLPV